MKVWPGLIVGFTLLAYGSIGLGNQPSQVNIELILDVSESMSGKVDDEVKIETAKRAIIDLLETFVSGLNIGFRVYGHRYHANESGTCTDTELLQPIQAFDSEVKSAIIESLATLQPKGKTPMAYSLEQALNDFIGLPGRSAIILISDGEETCGGAPETIADKISDLGLDLKVYVIGFDVASQGKLEPIATRTGGRYYSTQNASELALVLAQAVQEAIASPSLPPPGPEIKVEGADGVFSIAAMLLSTDLEAASAKVPPHVLVEHSSSAHELRIRYPHELLTRL